MVPIGVWSLMGEDAASGRDALEDSLAMASDHQWNDGENRLRKATEVIEAADVTDEMLIMAKSMEEVWFREDRWIDWRSFFAGFDGSVIPSTGREVDLGDELGSPAMNRIQRHIQRQRLAGAQSTLKRPRRAARWLPADVIEITHGSTIVRGTGLLAIEPIRDRPGV